VFIGGDEIAREHLAPFVREDDPRWLEIVTWSVRATFYAEELGITSGEDQEGISIPPTFRNSLAVRQFLGESAEPPNYIGNRFELNSEWASNIIEQVGNYEQIYESTIGQVLDDLRPDDCQVESDDATANGFTATPTRALPPECGVYSRGPNRLFSEGGLIVFPPFGVNSMTPTLTPTSVP
jgi:hypothetical protein